VLGCCESIQDGSPHQPPAPLLWGADDENLIFNDCQWKQTSPTDSCIECFWKIFEKRKKMNPLSYLIGSNNVPYLNVCIIVCKHEFLKVYKYLHICNKYSISTRGHWDKCISIL
jgi:hypothetical protein